MSMFHNLLIVGSEKLAIDPLQAMDETPRAGATDLARAWESNSTVRRRAHVYQLVLLMH